MKGLREIEKKYGTRPRIPMGHGKRFLEFHARGEMVDQKFVWCPVGYIISWNAGDYDHKYCPWCKEFFDGIA